MPGCVSVPADTSEDAFDRGGTEQIARPLQQAELNACHHAMGGGVDTAATSDKDARHYLQFATTSLEDCSTSESCIGDDILTVFDMLAVLFV
jgi:hypothetical protein